MGNEGSVLNEDKLEKEKKSKEHLHQECIQLIEAHPLEDYEKHEFIGTSAYNKIFSATHKASKCKVVVKALTKKYTEHCNFSYPPDEVLILQNIDHKFILKCFEVIILENITFMVTEMIPGQEFFDYFEAQNTHWEEEKVRIYARHIADIIHYLHKLNICHRDIKLENFVLDKNSMPKLIDFGFACKFAKGLVLTKYCGSPDYASPEIWLSKPYLGPDLDIWAFGIILYILATSFVPFLNPHQVVDLQLNYPAGIKLSDDFKEMMKGIFKYAFLRWDIETLITCKWMQHKLPDPPVEKIFKQPTKEEITKNIIEHYSDNIPKE